MCTSFRKAGAACELAFPPAVTSTETGSPLHTPPVLSCFTSTRAAVTVALPARTFSYRSGYFFLIVANAWASDDALFEMPASASFAGRWPRSGGATREPPEGARPLSWFLVPVFFSATFRNSPISVIASISRAVATAMAGAIRSGKSSESKQ